jgi:hypothetical protein
MPQREQLEQSVRRQLGWEAFWLAGDAFERRDLAACAENLELALSLWPRIRCSGPWWRLRCKLAMGPGAWARFQPLADRLRRKPTPSWQTAPQP